MPNPTRDTTAGRVYNDLRNLARREGRSTDGVMVDYLLERFLFRLASSPLGGTHFVLKGGLLLAQFGARRTTRDIDILGRRFPADETEIIRRISAIAGLPADDGIVFDTRSVKSVPIREDGEYHGLRLTMAATLARARLKLQLDISFGDPVTPEPVLVAYRQQLSDETFPLLGYPIATVIAEKLSTAVALGGLNTRDRDYADLYRLLSLHELDADALAPALAATATHRGIDLQPLGPLLDGFTERRQASYAAWRIRQSTAAASYPELFDVVVDTVTSFADPLLTGSVPGRTWRPQGRNWT
jgi:predicted nucleotidyltransferase component of viral defense system